jgi:5-carboxymethyl-2-hydroxymuconate isomerase
MPHIIIETSRKLDNSIAFKKHLLSLHNLFNQIDPSFEPSNCKSRIIIANSYLSGTNNEANFIHISVKIFPGRNSKIKGNLLTALHKFFLDLISKSYYKTDLSIEISELNKEFYIKSSNFN